MKKTIVISLIVIVVLGIAGYFLFKNFFLKEEIKPVSLIPRNTLLVYKSENFMEDWSKLKEKPIWENLENINHFNEISEAVNLLGSFFPTGQSLEKFSENKVFLASMHPVSNDEFDFLFLVKLAKLEDQKTAKDVLENIKKEKGLDLQTRHFNGFDIYELRGNNRRNFAYIHYKNFFIGSYSTLLLEDVIRNINNDLQTAFLSNYDSRHLSSGIREGSGRLFINLAQLSSGASLFVDKPLVQATILNNFGAISLLEGNFNENDLLLNGFSEAEGKNNFTWLQTFKGQDPQPFGLEDFLPDRTAVLHHMTFSNSMQWLSGLSQFWLSVNAGQLEQWEGIKVNYGLSRDTLFSLLSKEIAVATLESIQPSKPDKLAYLYTKDIRKGMDVMDQFAEAVSASVDDTVYYEEYAGIKIRQLDIAQFPSLAFGGLFSGFETCFFMPLDNYIVIGNSVQILKSLINDLEQEATWGKSVKYNEFLINSIGESNYNVVLNVPRLWAMLDGILSPKWRGLATKNSKTFKRVELIGAQFSHVEDEFYTSLSYSLGAPVLAEEEQRKLMTVHNVYINNHITTKPFVVRNHVNSSQEVVLQDSLNFIYLISSDGRILWKDSIEAQINIELRQIDFFANNKLQYFFSTPQALHIIDREGNEVPGFPLNPGFSIDQAAVIDYDNSKRYRFLVTDTQGNIYMYNKEGENLEGWQPRKMEARLSTPPGHIRVRGRDFIYALQEDGIVKVMTRRGEMVPGFPLSLGDKIHSPLFIEIGADIASTIFTAVTESGKIVQFNLEGTKVKEEQLYKPTAFTTFRLIPETSGISYVILRQDLRRVAVLNRKGEVQFEKDYLSTETMMAQYYHFGSEKELIAITDAVQDFTYLYDMSGNLINEMPLESGYEIGLLYLQNSNNYRIYSNYNQKFALGVF